METANSILITSLILCPNVPYECNTAIAHLVVLNKLLNSESFSQMMSVPTDSLNILAYYPLTEGQGSDYVFDRSINGLSV